MSEGVDGKEPEGVVRAQQAGEGAWWVKQPHPTLPFVWQTVAVLYVYPPPPAGQPYRESWFLVADAQGNGPGYAIWPWLKDKYDSNVKVVFGKIEGHDCGTWDHPAPLPPAGSGPVTYDPRHHAAMAGPLFDVPGI